MHVLIFICIYFTLFPILFDVNKGGEEYAYVLFCFKEIAGPNNYHTHSKNSRNHGLRGSIQFRGSLAFAQHVYYTKQQKHFKKSFSRLGCHHQKGGECNCKLLKSYLKHVF